MSEHLTDQDARSNEYERQFTIAAKALHAAIRTGVTNGGEGVSRLLATVAANLGGMHMITAGRPGSWEAEQVDRLLASTVGPDGDYLLQYRTRPIEIVECVELAMVDLDIDFLYDESFELIDAIEAEAAGNGDEAAYDRLARAGLLIDRLRASDYETYREAFERNVRDAAGALCSSRQLPDDVPVSVRWVDWKDQEQTTGSQEWATVEYELWEAARGNTSPPGFSQPRDAIHGSPGEQLRATGRMPHQRIPDLAGYAANPGESRA